MGDPKAIRRKLDQQVDPLPEEQLREVLRFVEPLHHDGVPADASANVNHYSGYLSLCDQTRSEREGCPATVGTEGS